MEKDTQQAFEKIHQKMDEGFYHGDKRFEQHDRKLEDLLLTVKQGFDETSQRFDGIDGQLGKVEGRLEKVGQDVRILKATMVTKEYLDDKLADLGAEIGRRIVNSAKKQEAFSRKLVEALKVEGVLSKARVEELEEMLV